MNNKWLTAKQAFQGTKFDQSEMDAVMNKIRQSMASQNLHIEYHHQLPQRISYELELRKFKVETHFEIGSCGSTGDFMYHLISWKIEDE